MPDTSQQYPSIAYEITLLEVRIDKIKQELFWYDNVPKDEEIVELVMQWRDMEKRLQVLNSMEKQQKDTSKPAP